MKRAPIIQRYPIIQRQPIVSDMIASDAIAYNNPEAVMEDSLKQSLLVNSVLTNQYAIEDAFVRRFASLWSLKYKTIKGKPTTYISKVNPFRNRPWQIQILDDPHPNKVVEKSRQLGVSELNVTECIHFLVTHPQTKIMYTFPTFHQMNDFSVTRVTPVFKDSAYLGSLLNPKVNSASTKKIGESYLLMRSSSSGSIGEGADIDVA